MTGTDSEKICKKIILKIGGSYANTVPYPQHGCNALTARVQLPLTTRVQLPLGSKGISTKQIPRVFKPRNCRETAAKLPDLTEGPFSL
jgi:hypothetical protein